jgi:hypothetical protein
MLRDPRLARVSANIWRRGARDGQERLRAWVPWRDRRFRALSLGRSDVFRIIRLELQRYVLIGYIAGYVGWCPSDSESPCNNLRAVCPRAEARIYEPGR